MKLNGIRARWLCGMGALALGLTVVAATPAQADPIVHTSPATTVTFSDGTLDPGQILTVTITIHFTVTSEGSIGDFILADNGNWTFESCTVSGAATSCDYTGAGSRFFWPKAPTSDASVTYRFAINPDAGGPTPYTGLITTDPHNLATVETIAGTLTLNHSDCTITGTDGPDILTGTDGDDIICGLGGDDIINGGNGNDTINGGAGDDTINGGNGTDTIHAGVGNDHVDGGNGNDTLTGNAGNDTVNGGNGDDILTDRDGTDTLNGGDGNDTLDTHDVIGGDTANGGPGDNTCTADATDTTTNC
jgi:Ca2+-binding RTX toxin-like protein